MAWKKAHVHVSIQRLPGEVMFFFSLDTWCKKGRVGIAPNKGEKA